MATRPIFAPQQQADAYVQVTSIDFVWHAGMSMSRRQMSMRSLHQAVHDYQPDKRILEVSRMSDNALGQALSAFNLTLAHPQSDKSISVESAFQASKVFERGGPFIDLLDATPIDAKRDLRLKQAGHLTGFRFNHEDWPNKPLTAFYDWIYINALHRHPELANAVTAYDIFTDIAFNPAKSINCQANAVALYVALVERGEIKSALSSPEAFLEMHAGALVKTDDIQAQGSLF
jgi:hypothetical protein